MAIPSVMSDLSTTANSNSPSGSENPGQGDDFLRAIQAILRATNAKGADIASATTTDIGAATGEFVDVTGTTTITGLGTIAAGIRRTVRFTGILILTHNGTSLILPSSANITTQAGDIAQFRSLGSGNWVCTDYLRKDGASVISGAPFVDSTAIIKGSADSTKLWRVEVDGFTSATTRVGTPPDKDITLAGLVDIRSYISGLTLSTAGASSTMSIAAGSCNDSTNVFNMQLSAIAKTTSAWSVGTAAGGLDTGAIANTTWYHFYVIRRPDTGVTDVVFSTNATTPTLPANYTQYRRIGSGRTNGSAQWILFTQLGDEFLWDAAVIDIDAANPGTSAVTRTLTVPLGVKVIAKISAGVYAASAQVAANFSSLDVSDQAPQAVATAALSGFSSVSAGTNVGTSAAWILTEHNIRTNTSSQIRSRISVSAANDRVGIITRGWVDLRGKDS